MQVPCDDEHFEIQSIKKPFEANDMNPELIVERFQ